MLSFLQSIFRSSTAGRGAEDRLIEAGIERLIDGTDPRLRAAAGYRKVLRPPVARSIEHVIALVDTLPTPVEISAARFATDPLLRAFFVSAEHLRETISYSEDLQKFLQDPPPLPEGTIHCLLTLDRVRKGVLGMQVQGDAVRKDVAQVVINFTQHRLVGLAPDEAEMRWELKKRAFDHLIQCALEALTARRATGERLTRQRRLLTKKLTAMQAGDWGINSMLQPSDPAAASFETLQRQLTDIEQELADLPLDPTTLDGQLATLVEALGHPEQHLHLEHTSLTLDPMGVLLEGAAAAGVTPLQLTEIVSGERRRIALPGYIVRADLLPPRDFIAEARRRLGEG